MQPISTHIKVLDSKKNAGGIVLHVPRYSEGLLPCSGLVATVALAAVLV